MIAGLPQSPSTHNPYRHPEAAKKRQEHVLRRMRDLGWITDEEFEQAFYEKLEFRHSWGVRAAGIWKRSAVSSLICLRKNFPPNLVLTLGFTEKTLSMNKG